MINIAYSTISYGSSGSDVKKLQQTLNNYGYKLDVDGQFGSKTQAAVKDYQRKNGLDVDGIVGVKTWGSLNTKKSSGNKAVPTSNKKQNNTTTVLKPVSPRPAYKKSDAVRAAENAVGQWEAQKPGAYESKYSQQIESILKDILNREEFSCNLNADPLYQQYREQYIQNGKKAMMDTVGQATALTGGYANSYAVNAGTQAYDEYLNDLNSVALDLRDRAYDKYNDEGDRLLEDITLLRSLDGDDYDKYLARLEGYYSDGEYLLNKLTAMSDSEYEQFLLEVKEWESDRDYALDIYRDALDREEFEEEMTFRKSEAKRDQANEDRDYALAKSRSKASSSSSSSSSKSKKASDEDAYKDDNFSDPPVTYGEFCSRTGVYSIMTEKEFAGSTVAKKYDSYQDYLEKMYKNYKKDD